MNAKLFSGATATALLLAGNLVIAQQDNNDADVQVAGILEEVIVTAQKREQNVLDVPIAISVYSGDRLRNQQISSMSDLDKVSPSITFSPSTHPSNASLRIRGIGTSVFSSAVEPSVSMVIDEVVIGRSGQSLTDLMDIERVEVLRGPQSTLFGKNASAGVISIVTKGATDTFEGSADFLYAEDNEFLAKGAISGPLSETLRGRAVAYYKDVGGNIDNIYDGRDLNGNKSYGFRGKLEYLPTDRLDVTLIGDYRKSDDECCMWQHRRVDDPFLANAIKPIVPGATNDQTNVDADVFNKTESWGLSLHFNYDLDTSSFTSITAYREWEAFSTMDIDGTPSQGDSSVFVGGLLSVDVNDNDSALEQFSQEFRLASDGSGPLNYVIGAYYSTLEYDNTFVRRVCLVNVPSEDCPTFIPLFPYPPYGVPGAQSSIFHSVTNNRNMALFGQMDWNATDRLTASFGLRILNDETKFDYQSPYEPLVEGDGIRPVPAPPGMTDGPDNPNRYGAGKVSDSAVTGKIALQYTVTDDVNLYGSYAHGYKGPTVDISVFGDLTEIDPETSKAWEFGLKSILADGRVFLNLALFDVKFDDFQGQQFDGIAGQYRLDNAGEVSTKGLEVDLTASVTDNLLVGFAGAYTDAKIDKYPAGPCWVPFSTDPGCINGSKDLAGGDLPNSPKWKFNVSGRYDLALPDSRFDMFFSGIYRWQSETQYSFDQNPNTIQSSYGLLDGNIGFISNSGRYTFTIFGKNLLDQDYAAIIFQDPVKINSINIDQYLAKNWRRYFGVQLRVMF